MKNSTEFVGLRLGDRLSRLAASNHPLLVWFAALGLGFLLAQGRIDPQMARQLAIEQQDERNRAIADRSKAKAYDLMLYLFAALMVAFSLIPDTPLPVILLMVAGYLLVVAFQIYWLVRLNKEM